MSVRTRTESRRGPTPSLIPGQGLELNSNAALRILTSSIPFKRRERAACRSMVDKLSEDQQELAARTSYAYLIASSKQQFLYKPSDDDRRWMAMRMARRYLVAAKGNADIALHKMKETISFREKMKIDCIRMHPSESDEWENVRHSPLCKIRYVIENDAMTNGGPLRVHGYDKFNRATLIKRPVHFPGTADENTIIGLHLYWIERAIACTELVSGGRREKINICVDFAGFYPSTEKRTPVATAKKLCQILQDHYPKRVNSWMAVEPPPVVLSLSKSLRLFKDPETKQSIAFVEGTDNFGAFCCLSI